MTKDDIATTLGRQDGVISRAQVLAGGGDDNDIERRLRRRAWARIHEGVYVEHTGPPTWRQRAWAAVLLHAPAALGGRSALEAHGLVEPSHHSPGREIELVVSRTRRVDDPPGIRTRQLRDFDAEALLHLSPPRVRVEHAVLTVASRSRSEDGAVATLAQAVQQGRTTPARLLASLDGRARLPRRALMLEVLSDVAAGAYSALERRYLCDVERAHGLPPGGRQARTPPVAVGAGRVAYRDVDYPAHRTVVELDGRLGHEKVADVWLDLDRDVDALVGGAITLRAGWRQVLDPCRLATSVGSVLATRGWQGVVRPCGPGCTTNERGSPAPGAEDPRPSAA